jgi:hypothetical protein
MLYSRNESCQASVTYYSGESSRPRPGVVTQTKKKKMLDTLLFDSPFPIPSIDTYLSQKYNINIAYQKKIIHAICKCNVKKGWASTTTTFIIYDNDI